MPAQHWDFSIGGILLDRFAVPEHFDLGHEVMMKVHKYPSETGTPQIKIHTQGAFPLPTSWKGMLYAGDDTDIPLNRALDLDYTTVQCNVVPFQYGPMSFTGVIKKFVYTPHNQLEIEYELEFEFITEDTSQVLGQSVPYATGTQTFFTSAQAATADMETAVGNSSTTLPASLTDSISAVTTALGGAYPLASQPLSVIQGLLGFLDSAITELTSFSNGLEDTAILENDLALLNASLAALSNFGLLRTNVAQLAGQGPFSQSVSNFTGSLFDVAAQYYPNVDPSTAAQTIAIANGILDLFVDTPTTLQLPPIFS